MLDFVRLQQQLQGFATYQQQQRDLLQEKLAAALDTWRAIGDVGELLEQVERARPSWLVARPLGERLQTRVTVPERPAQVTVVAADGSQIFPDRHVEPPCFLLNVGRVAFQLGTHEPVRLESIPRFCFRREELQEVLDERLASVSVEIVSALRDEFELEELLQLAREVRRDGRPLVALLDGTLIRWMIRRLHQRELEERFIQRYVCLLEQFQKARIPVASYISMPGGAEVVNLLRVARGECTPDPPALSLDGLTDRLLFAHLLQPGERSGLFLSGSHIQQAYADPHRIVYTYLSVPGPYGQAEIARVEFPRWVAEQPEWVALICAVLLKECVKGNGYPMVLAEAHEQAVIRAPEREAFYELIGRQLWRGGIAMEQSRKQTSKRRPVL
ncbi:DNA double-strand break repair nuclease NurA [Rhodothermus profundi]|uniref:NurA domain-containing protein n=1 Tax=Rhodothermus profundi TaxID=633813 RepID=A0A1M6PVF1_9BACT|nr:DNA double-strand break repair nuclease NurA [Rhodothermus profundi]SHK11935.1 NurA domain-containing protein [Rhodothermus profundi]